MTEVGNPRSQNETFSKSEKGYGKRKKEILYSSV